MNDTPKLASSGPMGQEGFPESHPDSPPGTFLLLLTNHQSAMYAAVVSMMGGAEGAQDVLQETNAALLEKAREYDPSRPFIAWAIGFARTQVLSWRKKQNRDRLVLDDELFDAVADRLVMESPIASRRLEALEGCLGKLPQGSRELVAARYVRGEPVQAIAVRMGRTENVVSVMLFRIRKALLDCMKTTLANQE